MNTHTASYLHTRTLHTTVVLALVTAISAWLLWPISHNKQRTVQSLLALVSESTQQCASNAAIHDSTNRFTAYTLLVMCQFSGANDHE